VRLKSLILFVVYWLSHSGFAQTAEDCDTLTESATDETLVAWNSLGPVLSRRGSDGPWQTKFGQLRAIAVVKDGLISEPRNAVLEKGEALWNVLDADQALVLAEIYPLFYLFRPGDSWCQFSAEIDQSEVEENALFTNDREFRLRLPTETEQAAFESNMYPSSYCANRAGLFLRDTSPDEIPPCDAPELIGLSDINGNQNPEFWATEILRYSTGIAVWEYDGRRYRKIFSACPQCGD
jgi:hypothetical protein